MYPGKFSVRKSRRFNRLTYRQTFAERWRRFLHAHFVSPAEVADRFEVDGTTALKWWQGLTAPSGWVIGDAVADPDLGPAAVAMMGARGC